LRGRFEIGRTDGVLDHDAQLEMRLLEYPDILRGRVPPAG
jgi:hypothetical protein